VTKQDRTFKELFRPGRIGSMALRNRIVMAPMGTYLAGRDGLVTDRLKSYYEARARGGAGLIIVGVASIDHPRGKVMTRQVGISEDKFIPGLAGLAEAVHRHGAKIGIQLQHGGRIAAPFLSGGNEAVSASVVPLVPAELGNTRALEVPEIARLVECFARAAGRAKGAGLDGVEIHAGHGYLINQFLSRSTNKRQDEYGGDLSNRSRFLREIITAIRDAVGRDYPVWCRLDGREYAIENGITLSEAQATARMSVEAGVNAVHVTGYGGSEGVHFTEAPLVYIPGYLAPLAREIKKTVNVPVIAVGRISPEMGERILRRGQADLIAMGRPLLADPDLPQKLMEGRADEVRKCIYCYTCVHQIFVRNNVTCAINPATGKESEPPAALPAGAKRVLVVGGGPAGLEAAATAAARGHRVTLYEKEKRLGGSLNFASILRPENAELVQYLIRQARRAKVDLKLGETVTPELAASLKPDVLVLASGAIRRNYTIPGIEGKNVIDGDKLRQRLGGYSPRFVRWVSRRWMPLGKRIAVLGGGLVGCELAVFLAERGRRVTILENTDQLAPEMAWPFKWMVLDKLNRYKVDILTEVKYETLRDGSVDIALKNGEKRSVAADTMIVATGTGPDGEIQAAFQGAAPEVYLVGDCGKMSFIKDSIAEGRRIGMAI
jgi:2,4-dienoyl-CoA reductase-like NADH-dependent reductase (Old Yellow Enzyme family)/thioredoxin reductase